MSNQSSEQALQQRHAHLLELSSVRVLSRSLSLARSLLCFACDWTLAQSAEKREWLVQLASQQRGKLQDVREQNEKNAESLISIQLHVSGDVGSPRKQGLRLQKT